MRKGTKKVIGAIIIIILILAVIWLVYESVKPEPASIEPVNELPNENMGLDNIINNLFENVETNVTTENEVVNETTTNATNTKETETTESSASTSEVVSGTAISREEKAVELAKEYYEEEYGSTEGIYFTYDSVYQDGRYIVRAGTADTGTMYLFVNLDTEIVSER